MLNNTADADYMYLLYYITRPVLVLTDVKEEMLSSALFLFYVLKFVDFVSDVLIKK